MNEIARQKGFAGEILVIPDPEIAPGDGQLDWADGGASRSYDNIHLQISKAINRYLEIHIDGPGALPIVDDCNGLDAIEPPPHTDSGTAEALELGETA